MELQNCASFFLFMLCFLSQVGSERIILEEEKAIRYFDQTDGLGNIVVLGGGEKGSSCFCFDFSRYKGLYSHKQIHQRCTVVFFN